MSDTPKPKQLLHLVFGGELDSVSTTEFKDLDKLDIVGVYPNYATAYAAWRAKAQGSVDNAADALFHRSFAPPARPGQPGAATLKARMRLWRQIGQQRWAKVTIGIVAAEYLRFVGRTTRFTLEPARHLCARRSRHADHLGVLARPASVGAGGAEDRASRSTCWCRGIATARSMRSPRERLGVGTIRGSGNHGGGFVHKAGVAAFQAMLDSLADGASIALSADVPKVARVAGLGIIKLAQASGRPIYPSAIATSRRYVVNNWDRTTINLPFGRGAGVAAEPISVPADADDAALEAARRLLEDRLNAATRRAYELVDQPRRGV